MDLEVIAMKENSELSRALELRPHHQMRFSVMLRMLFFEGKVSFSFALDTPSVFYVPPIGHNLAFGSIGNFSTAFLLNSFCICFFFCFFFWFFGFVFILRKTEVPEIVI